MHIRVIALMHQLDTTETDASKAPLLPVTPLRHWQVSCVLRMPNTPGKIALIARRGVKPVCSCQYRENKTSRMG